jgi:heme oxygenase
MKEMKETENLKMSLLSSDLFDSYLTLDDLITAINEFVDSQEYVVVKKRIKINKKKVLRKAILRCDKDEKHKYERFEKRETFSRQCECSFEIITILKDRD